MLEDFEHIKVHYPFKVTIITKDIIAPENLVNWLVESHPTIDYVIISNVKISISDSSRAVTYGFKNAEDAIAFKIRFGNG